MGMFQRTVLGVRKAVQFTSRRKMSNSSAKERYGNVGEDYDRLEGGVVGSMFRVKSIKPKWWTTSVLGPLFDGLLDGLTSESLPFWSESPWKTSALFVAYACSGFTFACALMTESISRQR